jgi:hypothetical protein
MTKPVHPVPTAAATRRGIDAAFERVCYPHVLIGTVPTDPGGLSHALVHPASGQAILINGQGIAVLHFSERVIDKLVSQGRLKRVDQPGPREAIIV